MPRRGKFDTSSEGSNTIRGTRARCSLLGRQRAIEHRQRQLACLKQHTQQVVAPQLRKSTVVLCISGGSASNDSWFCQFRVCCALSHLCCCAIAYSPVHISISAFPVTPFVSNNWQQPTLLHKQILFEAFYSDQGLRSDLRAWCPALHGLARSCWPGIASAKGQEDN